MGAGALPPGRASGGTRIAMVGIMIEDLGSVAAVNRSSTNTESRLWGVWGCLIGKNR